MYVSIMKYTAVACLPRPCAFTVKYGAVLFLAFEGFVCDKFLRPRETHGDSGAQTSCVCQISYPNSLLPRSDDYNSQLGNYQSLTLSEPTAHGAAPTGRSRIAHPCGAAVRGTLTDVAPLPCTTAARLRPPSPAARGVEADTGGSAESWRGCTGPTGKGKSSSLGDGARGRRRAARGAHARRRCG